MSTKQPSCTTCRCSHLVRDQDDKSITQLFCRAHPPTVGFVPRQRGEAVRFVPQSVFPPVEPDGWCNEWAPKAK